MIDPIARDTIIACAGLWLIASSPAALYGLVRNRLSWPFLSLAPITFFFVFFHFTGA